MKAKPIPFALTINDYRALRAEHEREAGYEADAWPSVCSEATCSCSLEALLECGACPMREPQRVELDEHEACMAGDVPRPLYFDGPEGGMWEGATPRETWREVLLPGLLGLALLVTIVACVWHGGRA